MFLEMSEEEEESLIYLLRAVLSYPKLAAYHTIARLILSELNGHDSN